MNKQTIEIIIVFFAILLPVSVYWVAKIFCLLSDKTKNPTCEPEQQQKEEEQNENNT